MLRKGNRPRGSSQPATVVQFMKLNIGEEQRNLVNLFDQMRCKRKRIIYDVAGFVGKWECENPLAMSEAFVYRIHRRLSIEEGAGSFY